MTTIRPRRWRALALLAAVGALALASCGDDNDDAGTTTSAAGDDTAAAVIRISGQDFSEQKTLGHVYSQFLQAKGFEVDLQDPIGSRDQLFEALTGDRIDMILDYSGSAVVFLGGEASEDPDATYEALLPLLEGEELEASAQTDAFNANALVALASWAEDNGVTTISDLAGVEGPITLGGAAECAERAECLVGYQDVYELDLEFTVVDYGPPLVAALEADEIQVAQYGSTAPEIATGTIVELEDDLGLQDAQNVVPVFRSSISSAELIAALDELSAAISTADLAAWNQATDVDKEDPVDVATAWLEDQGLL